MIPLVDLEKGLTQHEGVLDNLPEVPPMTYAPQRAPGRLSFIRIPTWRAPVPILPTYKPGIHSQSRSRHRWSALWVSKVDHPTAEFVELPDGFICGSMSGSDFCQWVLSSSQFVRDAIVCNMTWWRAKKAPFHHQFIVLTIAYRTSATAPFELYDLKLERIGKARSFRGSAEHRVTISKAQSLSHFAVNHTLLFGLLAAEDRADWDKLLPSKLFAIQLAFRDEIDEKWRGPPATLAHVSRYVENIVRLAPRYNLSSTNCYYFSRILMHVIALRHYSFQLIAANEHSDLEPRSKVHDPSAISSVFHFLWKQERSNGVLIHLRTLRLIKWFIIVLLFGAYIGVTVVLCMISSTASIGGMVAWVLLFPWIGTLLYAFLLDLSRALLVEPPQTNLERQTRQLVRILDDDPTLTHSRGKRGDYMPATGYRTTTIVSKPHPTRPITRKIKVTVWVDMDGPRAPVKPWKHPEQCYNGQRTSIDGQL